MAQKKSFKFLQRQLEDTFTEYLDAKNPRERLTRLREVRAYLRIIEQVAERLENEEYRRAPHLALHRVLTNYRQSNA